MERAATTAAAAAAAAKTRPKIALDLAGGDVLAQPERRAW
jgi:hypothetical protein